MLRDDDSPKKVKKREMKEGGGASPWGTKSTLRHGWFRTPLDSILGSNFAETDDVVPLLTRGLLELDDLSLSSVVISS